jgi:hypothetical protein
MIDEEKFSTGQSVFGFVSGHDFSHAAHLHITDWALSLHTVSNDKNPFPVRSYSEILCFQY